MGIQMASGGSLSSILTQIPISSLTAIREPQDLQAGAQAFVSAAAARVAPSSSANLMTGDTLAQILQLVQSDTAGSTSAGSAATNAQAGGQDSVTFPPANAPQSVQDAWSAATSGLSEEQKTSLTALASISEQHWTLQDGQLTPGASAGEPADFDYAQFAQSMIQGLQNSEQFDTTSTEQATLQAGVSAFQQFAANLSSTGS